MKIVIITQDAPMYLPEFLDRFLGLLGDHEVDSVVVSSPWAFPWRHRIRIDRHKTRMVNMARLLSIVESTQS